LITASPFLISLKIKICKYEINDFRFMSKSEAQAHVAESKNTYDFILLNEEPFGVNLETDLFYTGMYD